MQAMCAKLVEHPNNGARRMDKNMTATYTAEMIREAAPKTATGQEVAAWMLGLLEARGSAHFARVVRKNLAYAPNPNGCTAFAWDAWNTFRKLSDAKRA